MSNSSSSSSSSVSVFTIVNTYVVPALSFAALIFNSLVIIVMFLPSFRRSTAFVLRAFYVALAISDAGVVLAFNLPHWSDRTLGTHFMLGVMWQCKTLLYLYYWAESYSQWLFVLFTLNRLLVIAWPIKAKIFLTERMTLIMIGIVTTVCALFAIPAAIAFYYNPIKDSCTVTGAEPVISVIMVFLTTGEKYPYSTIIELILTTILVIKLILVSSKSRRLKGENTSRGASSSSAGVSSRELQTAVTLLLMLAVHTTIYVFEALSWETIYINNLFKFMSSDFVDWLTNVGNVADSLSCIVRLWNFWIYIFRMPAFRVGVLDIITCGLLLKQ